MSGAWAEPGRGRRGDLLHRWACAVGSAFANTHTEQPHGTYTCNYDGKHMPKQIDFACASMVWLPQVLAQAVESTATRSDHRPVTMCVQMPGDRREFVEVTAPRVIKNWVCTNSYDYNVTFRTSLGADPTLSHPAVHRQMAVHEVAEKM